MRKLSLHLLLTLALGLIITAFQLWWGIFPAALLASFLINPGSSRQHFLAGFTGGLMLWLIWSLVLYQDGGTIITDRMAALFSMTPSLLMVIGSLLGGLLGGLGSLAGALRWTGKRS